MPRWQDSPDFFFTLGDLLLDFAVATPARAARAAADDRGELAARARDRRAAAAATTRCAVAAASSPPTTWRCCTTARASHAKALHWRERARSRPDAARARASAVAVASRRTNWPVRRAISTHSPAPPPPTLVLLDSSPGAAAPPPASRHGPAASAPRAARLLARALARPSPLAGRPGRTPSASSGRSPRARSSRRRRCHGDTAYALAAAHAADQGRSRRRCRAARARDPRRASRAAGLAYTLESHALLGLGRAEESVDCLRTLPADVAARPRPPRLARRLAAAQPTATRRRSARSSTRWR